VVIAAAVLAAVVIVFATVVVVMTMTKPGQGPVAAPGPTTPTTTSVAPPPPPPPPPAPVPTAAPAPTVTVTATPPQPRGDQAGFLAEARTLPSYVLVSSSSDCSGAPTAAACATDDNVLALGAQACRAMDRYPNDSVAATRSVYPTSPSTSAGPSYDESLLMIYAADYLCPEHANMWAQF
jgi:hypothetical protein